MISDQDQFAYEVYKHKMPVVLGLFPEYKQRKPKPKFESKYYRYY